MPVTYLLQNFIFLYSADHFHGIDHLHESQLIENAARTMESNIDR